MTFEKRPIDANGWKIPGDGTLAKRVYDLTVAGKTVKEIAAETNSHVSAIYGAMADFKSAHAIYVYDVDLATGRATFVEKFWDTRDANGCVMEAYGRDSVRLAYSNGHFGAGLAPSDTAYLQAQEIARSQHRP